MVLTKTWRHAWWISILISCVFYQACQPTFEGEQVGIYTRQIFTNDSSKTKVQAGDLVHLYYCLKNGNTIVASSDMALEPAQIVIEQANPKALTTFERPLLWLGEGDSCIVHFPASKAPVSLNTYQDAFEANDYATIIYKVLKIE